MLGDLPVAASIPSADQGRAKKFYQDVLGLKLEHEDEGGALFECGQGTRLFVYPTKGAGESWHTLAAFNTSDIDAEVKDLESRGVKFEEYDLPGIKTVNGIATDPSGNKAAWFKDSEGNTLGVVQM